MGFKFVGIVIEPRQIRRSKTATNFTDPPTYGFAVANNQRARLAHGLSIVSSDPFFLSLAGVIGNPAYGSDSDLYGAMGYVRKSQRQSGLTQKSNVPPPTPPAH